MINLAQSLLVAVIVVLTALLVVMGVQVVNILKEFKRSIEKINKILDDAGTVSGSIAKPVSEFSEFFKGIKDGLKAFGWLADLIKKKDGQKEKIPEEPKKVLKEELKKEPVKEEKPSSHRFFLKKGQKLG